jgi:pyridoxamine 5'-phosphate oxidase
MDKREILDRLESVLAESEVAVLATVDPDGGPSMRWVTPVLIPGRPGNIYALTSPDFRKVSHIRSQPIVEWMVQTKNLTRIITVRGITEVLDNPSLKSEVLEAIGPRLQVFWRVNPKTEFVVIETEIQSITYFPAMEKKKITVDFGGGK